MKITIEFDRSMYMTADEIDHFILAVLRNRYMTQANEIIVRFTDGYYVVKSRERGNGFYTLDHVALESI
jgi:hypothetical protein